MSSDMKTLRDALKTAYQVAQDHDCEWDTNFVLKINQLAVALDELESLRSEVAPERAEALIAKDARNRCVTKLLKNK